MLRDHNRVLMQHLGVIGVDEINLYRVLIACYLVKTDQRIGN